MASRSVRLVALACLGALVVAGAPSARAAAPLDLWTGDLQRKIRDRSTLNLDIVPGPGYVEVFYDSEVNEAKWADSDPPYAVHTGDIIRIHGYLARGPGDGPHPAIVIGHGRGGSGSARLALALAALGYTAFAIDAPGAGLSTGGPLNTEQSWISVEERENEPSPEVSFLYHWAYAGMRALTALEELAALPANPYRIDPSRLGVVGASMGGQLVYYVNGVDDRVKAAVAIAVAGDMPGIMRYEGAWLYHGLYYYTRDGLISGTDALNAVSSCDDPTLRTFVRYFDPIRYAPTQHAPLLTLIGSHDQYFTVPAINTTFDATASAGTTDRFRKRIAMFPDGEHGIATGYDDLDTILPLLGTINAWLRFGLRRGPEPPRTPSIGMVETGGRMMFKVKARPGDKRILRVTLNVASQIDTTPEVPCDFMPVPLVRGGDAYYGSVRIGEAPPCGPPLTPENVLYFASVADKAGYTVSSRVYRGFEPMSFDGTFQPIIEHWRGDDLPVPPPPVCGAAAR